MDPNVIISRPSEFEAKIAALKKSGASSLHIVTDFDKTLTQAYVSGDRFVSSYQRIRDSGLLGDEYLSKSKALKEKYYPIEIDTKISFELKYQKMQEWWEKHWGILVKYGMRKDMIKRLVTDKTLKLRDGIAMFFRRLMEENIPILILSSGQGDVIKMKLKQTGLMSKNVHLIANFFEFDENGKAIGHSTPMITSVNKNETNVKEHSYYESVKKRSNVILLGDGLGDLGMAAGLEHDEVLSIGFLNDRVDERLEAFKKGYDVILLGDPNFKYVNDLLRDILS
ncbi:hypothetical protein HOC01_03515 [archaeon]|jgi:cytosolic 5'-nucleotidase 3|nr:hypothetical protein [archaeon]MBT6698520.1 hypothetical protein [archaeon]